MSKWAWFLFAVLQPRHINKQARDNTINLIHTVRDYVHYHIKCSKAYIHSRMRAKTSEFVKVLNRARPEPKGERQKKTITYGPVYHWPIVHTHSKFFSDHIISLFLEELSGIIFSSFLFAGARLLCRRNNSVSLPSAVAHADVLVLQMDLTANAAFNIPFNIFADLCLVLYLKSVPP